MKINKKIYFILLLILAIVLGGIFAMNKNAQENNNTGFDNIESEAQTESEEVFVETTSDEELLCVYVCGSVINPGIYELDNDSRIYNAIEAAGGFSESAATDYINLAESISDGQKIYIPSTDEVENGEIISSEESSGLVNINTADLVELSTLPGIGESRAQAIIDFRETNGKFETIEDIMKVSGIKEGAFEKIKDLISV